jgi:hypothetical protein
LYAAAKMRRKADDRDNVFHLVMFTKLPRIVKRCEKG